VKDLMIALDAHLATLAVERDYAKRDYNVSGMTEAVQRGNKMIRDMSNELAR
jgi:hypothetical protein